MANLIHQPFFDDSEVHIIRDCLEKLLKQTYRGVIKDKQRR